MSGETRRCEDTTAGAAGVTVIPSHELARHFAREARASRGGRSGRTQNEPDARDIHRWPLPPEALVPIKDHQNGPCGECRHLHDAEDRCVQGCGCPGWLPF